MKRRQLLHRSAGIGFLGVTNIENTDFTTENSARLVEVGFEHEVDVSSDRAQKSRIQFAAEPPSYQIGGEDLFVTGFASDAAERALVTNENLVDFESLHASPTGKLEADSTFNVVTQRSSSLQPIAGVTTAESYAPPSVETEFSSDEVTVTSAGKSVTVSNASEQRLELPSTEVEVEWRERTEQQVSDARAPEGTESVSKYESVTATATVRPVLRVRNNGVLNIKTGGVQ